MLGNKYDWRIIQVFGRKEHEAGCVEQCIESFVSLISRALNTLYITGCPPNDRAFPFSVQETVLERQGRGRKTVEQLYEAFIVLMDKIQGR